MVALFDLTLPDVRQPGADQHDIQGIEILVRVADDPLAAGVHHDIQLEIRVPVGRIVELGVGMVQQDEKIILFERSDLLLQFDVHVLRICSLTNIAKFIKRKIEFIQKIF